MRQSYIRNDSFDDDSDASRLVSYESPANDFSSWSDELIDANVNAPQRIVQSTQPPPIAIGPAAPPTAPPSPPPVMNQVIEFDEIDELVYDEPVAGEQSKSQYGVIAAASALVTSLLAIFAFVIWSYFPLDEFKGQYKILMHRFNQPHSSTPLATIIPVGEQEAALTKPKFANLPFDQAAPSELAENSADNLPALKKLSAVSQSPSQEPIAAPIADEFDESKIKASDNYGRRRDLGTAIEWAETFAQAADMANRQGKLVFLVHVAGNFAIEDVTCDAGQAFRTGALSDSRVGKFFAQYFVAAHQQIGDVRVAKVNGHLTKKGGDLVSYFCTPTGRVIHSVAGPVSPRQLWHEAKWAIETYQRAGEQPLEMQLQFIADAHLAWVSHQNDSWISQFAPLVPSALRDDQLNRIHKLLATTPLAPIATVNQQVQNKILDQAVSHASPNLDLANRSLRFAQESGRPLLFVFHDELDNCDGLEKWLAYLAAAESKSISLRTMLRDYIVIVLPHEEMTALAQRLDRASYAVPAGDVPLFVVARCNGEQVGAAAGHDHQQLVNELSRMQLMRGWSTR